MNFSTDVLEKSFKTPIVVDFWADWCGPCRVLGPVIEELANEANGKWQLVKLNTEQEPELAAEYKIKGIPAVKMIYKGDVVAEFTGALPKWQIQQWLSENLPDERIQEWEFILDQGTITDLMKFVKANPDLSKAAYDLGLQLIKTEPETAKQLLAGLKNDQKYANKAAASLAIIELLEIEHFEGQTEVFINHMQAAKKAYLENDLDACLRSLIESIMLNKAFENEMGRRVCLAIFFTLGEESEITKKYRRRFNMALY